jgi:hypothetical protein
MRGGGGGENPKSQRLPIRFGGIETRTPCMWTYHSCHTRVKIQAFWVRGIGSVLLVNATSKIVAARPIFLSPFWRCSKKKTDKKCSEIDISSKDNTHPPQTPGQVIPAQKKTEKKRGECVVSWWYVYLSIQSIPCGFWQK